MSLKEAAAFLQEHNDFLLVAHVSPDGDTLGSCFALRQALLAMGKKSLVACQEPLPHRYAFLPGAEELLSAEEPVSPKAVVYVDCAERTRAGTLNRYLLEALPTLCIDHHVTNPALRGEGYCDVNYVEDCAAAGELMCLLIEELRLPITKEIGVCLYTAIATDTGNFAYDSVTPRTFSLMGKIMESGFSLAEANRLLYRNERLPKVLLTSKAVTHLKLYCEGRAAVFTLTWEEITGAGGTGADCDGIIDTVRDIETVEAVCFIRESKSGEIKVSFRSKFSLDVAALSGAFGGGGHVHAAGCTLEGSLCEAEKRMTTALLQAFKENS